MAGKNTAAFGIFANRTNASEAIDRLIAAGFRSEDVSVLMQDNVGTKDFAHEKHTKAPEGTTTGVIAGGAIGGTLGVLAGLGALAIPGIGPFFVNSVLNRDPFMTCGVVLIFGLFLILCNLVADILYFVVDRRVNLQ